MYKEGANHSLIAKKFVIEAPTALPHNENFITQWKTAIISGHRFNSQVAQAIYAARLTTAAWIDSQGHLLCIFPHAVSSTFIAHLIIAKSGA